MARTYGLAGRMAAAFIDSRLTPLVIAASIALGGLVWHLLEPTGPKSAARFVPVLTATHGGAAVVGTF